MGLLRRVSMLVNIKDVLTGRLLRLLVSILPFCALDLVLRLSAVELTINLIEIFPSASALEFLMVSTSIRMLGMISRQLTRRQW